MKLSSRVLVAALALAAAGSASAQLTVPQTLGSGTELMFYAYDPQAGTSFVEDLGVNYANFLPTSTAAGTGFVDNLSSNAAWSTYLSTTLSTANADGYNYTSATQDTIWAVVAASSNGAANGNAYGIEGTESATYTGSMKLTAAQQAAAKNWMNGPLTLFVNGVNGIPTATPLTGYFSNSSGQDNAGQNVKNGQGALPGSLGNYVGATSSFNYYNITALNSLPTVYGNANGNSTFSFDGTKLTYSVPSQVAAVPEPSSYLMMLCGLLMVGALAVRRRNSK